MLFLSTPFCPHHETKMVIIRNVQIEQIPNTERELRFLLDGERIGRNETPESMELEDQDQIDCMLVQTGGFHCLS